MKVRVEYKCGKKITYTVDNYCIDEEHGFIELYSLKFASHAKKIDLDKIDRISQEELVFVDGM